MATQTTSNAPTSKQSKVQHYVNRQLDKTGRQVKTTDLITRLIVGVLLFVTVLQVYAIIDAWVWAFNPAARWVCFISLLVGALVYGALAVAPLFLRRVHPDYAAKMIEDERPSFKNSLLNYVSLRKQPARTHTAIMDAVSKQAAMDLQTVPDEAAVDQSNIVRSGLLLLTVTGFAVIYWLLSPKDPLLSFSRVLLPSIKQSAPSVVQVLDVSPGDVEIFFGDSVEVAATIKGSFSLEDVKLIYSTTDGQLTDQEVAMQPESDANRRFTATLPQDQAGIQQSLVYRVVARDGQSPGYDIVVKPNPSISVDSLTITPPKYTRLPVETLGGQDSIEGPEGSTVRIEALANLPIKLAYMELLKKKNGASSQTPGEDYRIVETVKMLVDSQDPQRAAGEFLAVLNNDRSDSKASHYRLKFISTTDDRNQRANISPIRVIADLAPELDVINPVKNRSKLPVNETMLIDARAFDIDYGISSIELQMDNRGSNVFPPKTMQLTSEQGNQRVRGQLRFTPEKHFLQSGDMVVFALTANDNRVSHLSGMLDPNSVQSRQYQIEITDAVENPQTPPKDQHQQNKKDDAHPNPPHNDDQQQQPDQQKQPPNKTNSDDNSDQQDSGDQPADPKESETGSSADQSGSAESSQSSDSSGGAGSDSGDSESRNSESKGDQGAENSEHSTDSGSSDSGSSDSGSQMNDGGRGQDGTPKQDGDRTEGAGQNPPGPDSSGSGSPEQNGSGKRDNQPEDSKESAVGNQSQQEPQQGSGKGSQEGSQVGSQQQQPNGSPEGTEGSAADSSGQSDESGNGEEQNPQQGPQGGDDQGQASGNRQSLGENATDGEVMSRLEEMIKEEQAKEGQGQKGGREPADEASAAEQNTGTGKDPEQKNARQSAGTGSMQQDDAKAADKGAQNNAQRGDGSSSSSQGEQDGTAKGSSGSKTGDQSDEGASSEDSNKGQSNETGGNEAGDARTESGNENSTGAQEGKGQPGQAKEGGAPPSDQQGENGGNQQPQEPTAQQSGNQPAGGEQPAESGQQPGQQKNQQGQREQPQQGEQPGEGQGAQPGEGQAQGQGGQAQDGGAGSGEGAGSGSGEGSGEGEGGGDGDGKGSGAASKPTKQGGGSGSGGGRQHNMVKEKVNLEHARKATDMVLNRLEEERYDPDPDLLDELNWSKDDLNQFLDRWREMKRQAESGTDPAAKRRYEQAIKSLGLSPDARQRKVKGKSDKKTGFKTDSAVNRPPPKIAPAFKAYLRDRNRANQE